MVITKGVAAIRRRNALFIILAAVLSTWPLAGTSADTAPAASPNAAPATSPNAAPAATQDDWGLAKAAETRGDYPAMAKILLPMAEQGDVAAQYTVGLLYDTGQSGRKDHAEAAKWYRKAAEQGFARAQYYLGDIYYRDNTGLQNYAEAMKWYLRAADQGTAMAQHTLGIMYVKGQGTAVDYVQSYKWFSLAASLLPAGGGTEYKSMATKARDAVATKMTAEQIVQAQKLVDDWKPVKQHVPGKAPLVD
jgi:TPR repeat protein